MALINKLLFGLFLCSVSVLYAQKGISYQGVVLYPSVELPGIDSKVTPYSEKDVCFRFSIYDDTNALEYSETHTTTTDYYGQVNLIIGRGDNPSIAGRLEVLKWDGTAKFLKVELDYADSCSSWEEIAYDELNYVPFAFHALNSQASQIFAQGTNPIVVNGTGSNVDPVIVAFDGELEDLNDVDFTSTPIANQVLIFNGSEWIAGSNDDLDPDPTNELQTIVSADSGNLVVAGSDSGALLTSLDDADADPNNEIQNLSLTGDNLSISGSTTTVNLSAYLDNTDDQNIQNLALDAATNILTVGIEDGTSSSVDLSGLVETDDQNLTGATLSGTVLQIDIEDGSPASVDLASLHDGTGTDDQNIQGLALDAATNILTVGIEDGTSSSVDLSGLVGTDDQNLTGATLSGTVLQIDIEDGSPASVDLASLQDGTGTDDQNIQGLALDGATNILTVGIEDGTSSTVDLSGLVGTDDQNLTGATLSGTVLQLDIEDGSPASVDLASLHDGTGTDDQNIQGLALDAATNILTVGIEDGTSSTVDLSGLVGTDNQNLTGATLSGTVLQIDIEDGSPASVDLASLHDGTGTDDQNIQGLALDAATNILTVGIEDGTSSTVDLSGLVGTDDQNLTGATLSGTVLQLDIEDGSPASVDLASLQDGTGTDDQNIQGLALDAATNILTVGIEDGTSSTVDLSGLVGTDNQNLTGATLSGTVLQLDIEDGSPASVDLASLQDGTGTDDQNLNLTGNTLSISNGSTTVDLSPYLDNSDNQDLNLTGNTLSISNGSTTVDLSPYLDDTDNQNLTAGPNSGEVSITGGNSVTLNVNDADSDPTNEIQDLSLNTKILSITNNLTATPINLTEVLDLADAADVTINAPADNEVLAFEGGLWVNKPLKDLQRVDLASNYPAAPEGNQLIVGLPSSPNSSNLRFVNIDEVDILIIDNSSDNSFITLEDLDVSRNGKILKIVESDNQNPKIKTVLDIFYNPSNPNDDNYLFIDIQEIILGGVGGSANRREIKYESVELLWYNGIWTPMR